MLCEYLLRFQKKIMQKNPTITTGVLYAHHSQKKKPNTEYASYTIRERDREKNILIFEDFNYTSI